MKAKTKMNAKIEMNFIALFVGLLSIVMSVKASADVPHLFPVQGSLTDASGAPIDALTDITFSLYAEESGGAALWTDTFSDVDVETGFFSVYLGSNNPLDFSALLINAEIWLGITVESDPEMNRIRLAAVPFAVEAETCARVGTLTEMDINNNFLSSSAPAASITSTQMSNWSTAYSWGDHAEAGYLTSYTETDPEYAESPAADISSDDITNWDTAYSWGDHAEAGYLTSYTEIDPEYALSPAADIASDDISNWDTAFNWGDHAEAGYLTSEDWATPGNIGTTTRASGDFTSLDANDGLTVSSGTVTIKPSGSGGSSGQVLTTDGNGNASWQNISTSMVSLVSIGTCSSESAATEKTVSLSNFALTVGSTILVTFSNANTASSPTLNVNSTGAKSIASEDGTLASATNPAYFPAISTVEFTYNGAYWVYKKRVVTNYVADTSYYRIWSDGYVEMGGVASSPTTFPLQLSKVSSITLTPSGSSGSSDYSSQFHSFTTSDGKYTGFNNVIRNAATYYEVKGYR